MIAHRIQLSSDSLNLRVDVDDNGRIAIAAIAGGGTSLRAGHHPPALELQSVEAPHPTPVLRLAGSTGAARLRYREHQTGVDGETHWLAVTAEDADRFRARWLLRTRAGSAALTSTVEVTNIGSDELSLGALPSLSLPVTGEAAGAAVGLVGIWLGARNLVGPHVLLGMDPHGPHASSSHWRRPVELGLSSAMQRRPSTSQSR